MPTREEKRQELLREHKRAQDSVRRLTLQLNRTYPKLDAVGVNELKKQIENATAEFKKLDARVNRGGATNSRGTAETAGVV